MVSWVNFLWCWLYYARCDFWNAARRKKWDYDGARDIDEALRVTQNGDITMAIVTITLPAGARISEVKLSLKCFTIFQKQHDNCILSLLLIYSPSIATLFQKLRIYGKPICNLRGVML